jgi:hypothetical protein
MTDYVWTDGEVEVVAQSYDQAMFLYETAGHGKVWMRTFSDEPPNFLEGVTDVTPSKPPN